MVAGKMAHKAGSLLRSSFATSSASRIATSLRRGVATSSRTANSGTGRAILGLGALALPVSFSSLCFKPLADKVQTYFYYNRVYLDSASRPDVLDETSPDDIHPAHPDQPQAAAKKSSDDKSGKGKKGQVKISDVLAKKEGDEVWVVIKGHVYK
jgi:hypothetical protein